MDLGREDTRWEGPASTAPLPDVVPQAETPPEPPDSLTPISDDRPPPADKGFLLRLFESKLFDMSMAITYLFNSKEPGVQSYIGKII